MNRRGFLLGVAGVLVAPAIVRASSLMRVASIVAIDLPSIVGDGVHNDMPGILALMKGEVVNISPGLYARCDGKSLVLGAGTYCLKGDDVGDRFRHRVGIPVGDDWRIAW